MMKRFFGLVAFALTPVLVCSGCGGSSGPELVPVSGIVVGADGPVADAGVEFEPEEGKASFARTREDGTFVMIYKVGEPGVVVGTHTVKVSVAGGAGEAEEAIDPSGKEKAVTVAGGVDEAAEPDFYVMPEKYFAEAGAADGTLNIDLTTIPK